MAVLTGLAGLAGLVGSAGLAWLCILRIVRASKVKCNLFVLICLRIPGPEHPPLDSVRGDIEFAVVFASVASVAINFKSMPEQDRAFQASGFQAIMLDSGF